MDDRLRSVEIALGQVDQRLETLDAPTCLRRYRAPIEIRGVREGLVENLES